METTVQHTGSLLIVDDFKTNVLYLSSIFEKKGFKVKGAFNGQEAIAVLKKTKFDLILLDVVMPDMDGYEVCAEIRKSGTNKDTPIIFITSKNDEKSILKGFETGGQDYVSRPFKEKELFARVATHIQLIAQKKELAEINTNLETLVELRTKELNNALFKLSESYKKLQEAKYELEKLDLAKEQFLKIISHEIRTPLNGIIGFGDILAESLKDTKFKDYLSHMLDSVKRLETFSNRALILSEIKTGKYKDNDDNIDINQIISSIERKIKHEINSKKLQIQINITDGIIFSNDELVNQVLDQILDNAIRHAPVNSIIEITEINGKEKYKIIEIINQGLGFPETYLRAKNKLFLKENFINHHAGMGLYSVNLLMGHLGGKLKIENLIEGGAKVTLFFRTNI